MEHVRQHVWEHFWENVYFFSGFFALTLVAVTFSGWMMAFTPDGNFRVTMILLAVRSSLILYFFATMLQKYTLAYRTIFFAVFFLFCMVFLCLFAYHDVLGTFKL